MKHSRQSHHVFYATTSVERLYSIFIGPLIVIIFIVLVLKFLPLASSHEKLISFSDLFVASGHTLVRLLIAYFFALICALPIALVATYNKFTEKVFLPMFDILESIPVLAFFPIIILFFINMNFLNGAAIFILFLSMLWNIVFTVVGGLKIIPRDIRSASKVFGITGWSYFKQVLIPAVFPEIVTGSILAFAQGWNLIIVAEVIHTYIPSGVASQDLTGIGSILVHASASGQTDLFVACIGVMIIVIAFFNYFIWQSLIHYAQRFKFE